MLISQIAFVSVGARSKDFEWLSGEAAYRNTENIFLCCMAGAAHNVTYFTADMDEEVLRLNNCNASNGLLERKRLE